MHPLLRLQAPTPGWYTSGVFADIALFALLELSLAVAVWLVRAQKSEVEDLELATTRSMMLADERASRIEERLDSLDERQRQCEQLAHEAGAKTDLLANMAMDD